MKKPYGVGIMFGTYIAWNIRRALKKHYEENFAGQEDTREIWYTSDTKDLK
ncbi:MAG: hypothetical protein J6C84_04445 [Lachnospiraceae bacterium]|nr:hypothetical protein [Lachnospiraceae bacterium]